MDKKLQLPAVRQTFYFHAQNYTPILRGGGGGVLVRRAGMGTDREDAGNSPHPPHPPHPTANTSGPQAAEGTASCFLRERVETPMKCWA